MNKGYGTIRRGGKQELAHRVSFELHNGEIPETLCVLHTCDNPPCVNPAHLFLGTKEDNAQDMADKDRRYQPDNKGFKNPNIKLTEDDIKEIKRLLQLGMYQFIIAGKFNVSQAHINRIKMGRVWGEL